MKWGKTYLLHGPPIITNVKQVNLVKSTGKEFAKDNKAFITEL